MDGWWSGLRLGSVEAHPLGNDSCHGGASMSLSDLGLCREIHVDNFYSCEILGAQQEHG